MEKDPLSPFEAASSESSKEKKKKSKRAPGHVPLPVQAELHVIAEQKRSDKPESRTKKRKKKSAKSPGKPEAGVTVAAEIPPVTEEGPKKAKRASAEDHRTAEKKPDKPPTHTKEAVSADDEAAETVTPTAEKAEKAAHARDEVELEHGATNEHAEQKKEEETEFLGELLVSERAIRQREREQVPLQETEVVLSSAAQTPESSDEDQQSSRPSSTRTASASTAALPLSAASASAAHASSAGPRPSRGVRSSGVGGAVPPVVPPFGPGMPGGPSMPNSAPSAPYANTMPVRANTVPPTVASAERVRPAERRGSFAGGFLFGALVEHVRHRRRENRREKEHQTALKNMTKEQQAIQEKLRETERKTARTKTELEQRLEQLRAEKSKVEAAVKPERASQKPVDAQDTERVAAKPEERAKALASSKEEELKAAREKLAQALAAEAAPDDAPAEVPKDRRVETSAWHRIEVDKETGKAVENPTVAYGEEFKKEQQQERLRREIEAASADGAEVRARYADAPNPNASPLYDHTGANDAAATSKHDRQHRRGARLPAVNTTDLGLAGLLVVVVVAIIFALTA